MTARYSCAVLTRKGEFPSELHWAAIAVEAAGHRQRLTGLLTAQQFKSLWPHPKHMAQTDTCSSVEWK